MVCLLQSAEIEVAGRRELRTWEVSEENGRPFQLAEIADDFTHVIAVEDIKYTIFSGAKNDARARRHHRRARPKILVTVSPGASAVPERYEPVNGFQLFTALRSYQAQLHKRFAKIGFAVKIDQLPIRSLGISAVPGHNVNIAVLIRRRTLRGLPDPAAKAAGGRNPSGDLAPSIHVVRHHPTVRRAGVLTSCRGHKQLFVLTLQRHKQQCRALLLVVVKRNRLARIILYARLNRQRRLELLAVFQP